MAAPVLFPSVNRLLLREALPGYLPVGLPGVRSRAAENSVDECKCNGQIHKSFCVQTLHHTPLTSRHALAGTLRPEPEGEARVGSSLQTPEVQCQCGGVHRVVCN